VTFLEEAQRLLSRFVCVYFGYISQGAAWGALVGWWWYHSRRRGNCSHVLTACIQTTSLKGAQAVRSETDIVGSHTCLLITLCT